MGSNLSHTKSAFISSDVSGDVMLFVLVVVTGVDLTGCNDLPFVYRNENKIYYFVGDGWDLTRTAELGEQAFVVLTMF